MILKTNDSNLEVKITFSKANTFEETVCKEDETLLQLIPSMSMGKGGGNFLINLIHHFQASDKKLSKIEVGEFLDNYFEDNQTCMFDLYVDIIKEFSIHGVFEKELGFKLATMLKETLTEVAEDLIPEKKEKKENTSE